MQDTMHNQDTERRRSHDLPPGNPLNPGQLTSRELEIMGMIGRGLSNAEIAGMLFLSINTVKTHIRTAYRRLGINRRVDAVRWAIGHQLPGEPAPQH